MELVLVTLSSLLAGFVDAVVGGGGLILVPALFAVFPGTPPATLFGVNKSASIWGTAAATVQFARRVQMPWRALLPSAVVTCIGSFAGAWLVTQISPDFLRKLLPVILLGVLGYTLWRKQLGHEHQPRFSGRSETVAMSAVGLVIGAYDGFFGPGTGSFFVFLFVRWLGYDFLHASASAKLLNVSSNFAALVLFVSTGHIWWHMVLPIAVANVIGSAIGSRMAIKHGAGFIRIMFILVVSALILKTGSDAWL
ncbi:TSUP family transporter [Hydrogenophaga sp. 5NK40-0174]|uniref:TSUP family transporter n=1 Tax=Hydrogenophaga sp. 5NK40-0174 TaxID=3127649 RepID=UPI003109F710